MSNSLRPHESQHARPPCPSPTPGVHSDSRPSSQRCHPAISSSVVPFSSCPQSLPGNTAMWFIYIYVHTSEHVSVSVCSIVQLCPTVCNPIDLYPTRLLCSWNFQEKILMLVVISSSRGSSQHRDWTYVSCTVRQFLYHWVTWEACVCVCVCVCVYFRFSSVF